MTGTTLTGTIWHSRIDDAPVAMAAAGGLVAIGGAGGTAWVLDASDGRPTATLTLPGGLLDLAFSPDGVHLALTGPLGYALWTAATGHTLVVETTRWSARARWAAPDRVAVADGRTVAVLGVDGRELWRTAPAPSTVTDLVWLRDGRRLALTAYNGVRCHERHRPDPVAAYTYTGSHLAIAASPNGRWLCTGNQDASIHIWRTRDATELTMSGYPGKVSRLAFDDTGRWLAADGAPEVTVWDFAGKGPRGSSPRMLRAHDGVTALAWRPGATATLATGGAEGTLAVWDATAGTPGRSRTTRTRWELDDQVTALTWGGRDRLLAATSDGAVRCLAPGT
ncbi:WD40 repeat domain-containing protein [Actinoallomurus rhizosphaericola]|uniref:WD40 repeat domain-containing protein n=1 Tax=Actinoallomurus rhizosphaericola TaxID=2952536 RepID=UPI002092564A|nr:WD40 repeat domain-containing protein [Actinoallomurus rhizosphaericola]MCO5996691.1 WD40 repeat domain-containing protein [Actinoallomurus rhizosphaericola]